MLVPLPPRDRELIQIMDSALADATQRAGDWLLCRKGCTKCCIGTFAINQLDAARLRHGLASLEISDPQRAARVKQRTEQTVQRLSATFPGDPATGILAVGEEAEDRFADFANDEPCPVLDPTTGACDLYEFRPMICRTFGPPVHAEDEDEDTLGVCELCFDGASDEEVAACEMKVDPDGLEPKLLEELEHSTGTHGNTIVAFSFIDT